MDRMMCISLVILLILLAGPGTEAAALTGTDAAAAVMPTSSSTSPMKLEDGVVPELEVSATVDLEIHRRVLAGTRISAGTLNGNKGACIKTCPARGGPYTGRACLRRFQCRH